jgi:parvulin-like peptidyl-prolyl isomerase
MQSIRILAALMVAIAGLAAAEPEGEPLVRVNGQSITAADLDQYIALTQANSTSVAPEASSELAGYRRREALRGLMDHYILLGLAREAYGEAATAEEALEEFAEEKQRKLEERVGSRLKAHGLLAEHGMSMSDYRQRRVDSALVDNLLWERVLSNLTVRPHEVRQHYRTHRDEFRQPRTVRYRQILLTVLNPSEDASQQLKAKLLRQEILHGEDFAALADRHSADAETYPGGLRSVEVPDDRPEWRPAAVAGLEPGDLSAVRKTAGGYAIVRLEQVLEPRVEPFEEVQARIRATLLAQKRGRARADYVERMRREARIQYLPAGEELLRGTAP